MKCPLLRRSYLMTARFISIRDSTFAVFPSLGGRQFEADNLDQMEWVGRYLGRLHQTGCKQRFTARPEIGVQGVPAGTASGV